MLLGMARTRKRTTDDLTPGTPAGDAYLQRMAKERQRRGFHGFTRKGRFDRSMGSTIQKSGVSRQGGTSKLPMRRRKG